MKETVELRNKPELKIILNSENFEVIDAAKPRNNGTYVFRHIKKLELNEERTDWFISVMTFIVGLFVGGHATGTYKNRANLKIETDNQKLQIWLDNVDFSKAQKVMRLIKSKKAFI
ncbi:hypothetical protein [Zobellia uliginosa]|uniref:hypothetical protein n=1 Tax=Zobellia uliginosa TaxID=143224 RepID=UPI001C0719DA|nr:hypothetical protein [Zobellia uliginosa]MBU2946231.1 hypothetical protein [Zobellia uliginosa]